jgi:hypothetical protein
MQWIPAQGRDDRKNRDDGQMKAGMADKWMQGWQTKQG